jgi:aspartate/methionine/tyrosine aminotransferase
MALKVAGRGRIPPFIVMDVVRAAEARAAAGRDVLHMEIGQPSTPAPRGVLAAAQAALAGDVLGYTGAFGLEALRARIADWYRARYGVAVPVERIALTPGSSGAFVLGFLAAFEPGDRVALATPCYPAYRNILTALGIEVVLVPADAGHGFQPTPELLRRAGPLDGLVIASPANPTGTMLGAADLAALCEWCRAAGVRLVSDEIYHGITYGPAATTALAFGDDAIIVNSFSKYFSMTGWRLGWMIVPPDMVRAIECLAQNLFISPPTLSQHAAMAAFDCVPELEENVARYARNRALLLAELPKAGFDRLAPADGAFYIYADVAHLTNDSSAFCRRMLEDVGVAATPGVDFDPERGDRSLRFSFAGATETMAEAARRLVAWRR